MEVGFLTIYLSEISECNNMEYRIINTTEGFEALKPRWEKMEQQASGISFFSTFEFCFTWWTVYQNQPEYNLWIICVYQNKYLVGIAPFVIKSQRKRFVKYKSLSFLASLGYNDFLTVPELSVKLETIYKLVFIVIEENKHLWDEIHLTHISQKSPLSKYVLKSNFNPKFNYLIENPFIDLTKFKNLDSFCMEHLPAKTRQYSNRLKKLTNYSLHITTENLVGTFSEIHIAEKNYLKKKGKVERHSIFENVLKKELWEFIFVKGLMMSYYLYDNNRKRIIIYNSGSIFRNIFYSINTAFDPAYEKLGVGKIMYYEIFRENFSNPIWSLFDTGTGRYPWKFEWTSDFNLLYQLHYIKPESRHLKLLKKLRKIKQALKN